MTGKASSVIPPRCTLMMVISTTLLVCQPLLLPSAEACMCMKPDLEREFATSDYAIVINVTGQVKSHSPIQLRDLSKRKISSNSQVTSIPLPSPSSSSLSTSSTNSRSTLIFPKSANQQPYIPSSMTNYPTMSSFSKMLSPKGPNAASAFYFPSSKQASFPFSSSHHSNLPQYPSASNGYPSYSQLIQSYPYPAYANYRAQASAPVAAPVVLRREEKGGGAEGEERTIEREASVPVSSTPSNEVPYVQFEELERVFSFTLLDDVKIADPKVRQALSNRMFYTNPRTSCYPNLQVNKKYLIWGKVDFMKRIFITTCNSLEYDSLENEEMQTIDKFIRLSSGSASTSNNNHAARK